MKINATVKSTAQSAGKHAFGSLLVALCAGVLSGSALQADEPKVDAKAIQKSLLLHASFDHSIDADFAKGDKTLRHGASAGKRPEATDGLPDSGNVKWEKEGGKSGGYLNFTTGKGPIAFYDAAKNFPELKPNFSATVSLWLKADMKNGLNEGFCDPIQITSKQWNDAAMFIEFEKRGDDIPFRLGVYADMNVWNPKGIPFSEVPVEDRQLVGVQNPPFEPNQWTHVLVTLENFNSSQPDGVATLYFNGEKAAVLSPREQTFTWILEEATIALGVLYVGGLDELAIFDRALSADEIRHVYKLDQGIKTLSK